MIAKTILALWLCSLGSASPTLPRDTATYPPLSKSKGFNLKINLTHPDDDFDPPIQHTFVTTIHVGAGESQVGSSPSKGPVFFQNGTQEAYAAGQGTVVTLGGTPSIGAGFKLIADEDPKGWSTSNLDFGPGKPGISLHQEPFAYLTPEKFYACSEALEYYGGKHFVVIRQSAEGDHVPPQCRSVRLLPQCAELAELSEDSYASYDYALESPCYDDVAAIEWTKYSQ